MCKIRTYARFSGRPGVEKRTCPLKPGRMAILLKVRNRSSETCSADISTLWLIFQLNHILVCPMQCMALDRYKITWVFVCLSVCLKYLSLSIANITVRQIFSIFFDDAAAWRRLPVLQSCTTEKFDGSLADSTTRIRPVGDSSTTSIITWADQQRYAPPADRTRATPTNQFDWLGQTYCSII